MESIQNLAARIQSEETLPPRMRMWAGKALAREALTAGEMQSILQTPDEEVWKLVRAAWAVRKKFFGRRVQIHILLNARSGLCPEDCAYCSQSSAAATEVDKHPLVPKEQILAGARRAARAKAFRYCIATSGRGPSDADIEALCGAVREIKEEIPIEVCCSLGLLSAEHARRLKAAGADRVNHNLNTSERFHPEICGTHTYADRIETLRNVKSAGLDVCCGVIAGMGETEEDLVAAASALRELDVDSIPINFLNPIPGTPLAGARALTPLRCFKILSLFRLANPAKEVRAAGGSEVNLGELRPLALFAANSLFVDGYLTTPGTAAEDTYRFLKELGFEVEECRRESFAAAG